MSAVSACFNFHPTSAFHPSTHIIIRYNLERDLNTQNSERHRLLADLSRLQNNFNQEKELTRLERDRNAKLEALVRERRKKCKEYEEALVLLWLVLAAWNQLNYLYSLFPSHGCFLRFVPFNPPGILFPRLPSEGSRFRSLLPPQPLPSARSCQGLFFPRQRSPANKSPRVVTEPLSRRYRARSCWGCPCTNNLTYAFLTELEKDSPAL